MTLSEKIDKIAVEVSEIHEYVMSVNQKIDNHILPEQPCAKIDTHYKENHKGYTIKILGLFSGMVVFFLLVYEGIRSLLEKGK